MSHFTVLILGDDIEGQLERYDENTSVAPYKDYETGDPKDFWCVKSLRESGLITVPDSELTWQIVADAYNSRYSDDEGDRYFIDDDGDMYRMSTYNPDSKWDWYQVGGRWSGYFDVKPGCEGMVRLGERSWANEGKTIETTKCDQGLKKYLDIEGMRDRAGQRNGEWWDKYQAAVAGTPALVSWAYYLNQVKANTLTIEQARDQYHGQPRLKAASEKLKGDLGFMFDHDEMQAPRDVYVERGRAGAVPGFACLVNGRWYEPGKMGWWGVSTDNESTRAGYWEVVNGFIDEASDDTLLTAVDCHI